MLAYIENILQEFRKCFSRTASFKWFVISVIGMMLRSDHLGVTSIIRDLALSPGCYESLLHFFRSSAYRMDALRAQWYRVILQRAPLEKCKGRFILVGDGVKQPKEARRMPCVKKMVQESETVSKPEYIHGHLFGAIGVVAGTLAKHFCIPLKVNIQDGLKEAASWKESEGIDDISGMNHVEQIVASAFEAAKVMGNCYVLLDRYFLSKTALKLAARLNAGREEALVEIITKAKSNCTAYMEPLRRPPGSKGRPSLKGKKIHVADLFDQPQRFTKARVSVYGGTEVVSYYCTDLLWGQGLYQKLRFVLVNYGDMQSILVSTDLTLRPKRIIELYAKRSSIESLFREMKQQVGAFCYHFWTGCLPRLNRFARKGTGDVLSRVVKPADRRKVLHTVKAIHSFVFCATVAIGIAQVISLDDRLSTGIQTIRYLRTYSAGAPSEGSVMYYFRKRFFLFMAKSPESFITQYIREKQPPVMDADEAA